VSGQGMPYCLAMLDPQPTRPCYGCPDSQEGPHVHCWMGTPHIHLLTDLGTVVPVAATIRP